jgi:tetratricopeptide (TPR) repeat protein
LEQLGLAYFFEDDYENAVTFLSESLKSEESSSVLSKLGEIHAIRKDYPMAESFIERALRINPKSKNSYYVLALVEEAKGDVDKAVEYYKKELEVNPTDYRASYNLANNLRERSDHGEALEYYQRTIQANPGFKMAYFMVAKYLFDRSENLPEAIDLCKKGVDIPPADEFTLLGYQILTDIYAKQGDRKNYDFYLAEGDRLYQELKAKGEISIR